MSDLANHEGGVRQLLAVPDSIPLFRYIITAPLDDRLSVLIEINLASYDAWKKSSSEACAISRMLAELGDAGISVYTCINGSLPIYEIKEPTKSLNFLSPCILNLINEESRCSNKDKKVHKAIEEMLTTGYTHLRYDSVIDILRGRALDKDGKVVLEWGRRSGDERG